MTTILMTGASRGLGRRAAETMLAADPTLQPLVVARGSSSTFAVNVLANYVLATSLPFASPRPR
jgi:NAD(P)-dependent dehydrogenase (short-subunit alcohol dehydrogenase family)